MNYIGISNGFHDAAVSVVDDYGNILFAGHSERYSKRKNDKNLHHKLITDALKHTTNNYELHYYERPFYRFLRGIRTGEGLDFNLFNNKKLLGKDVINRFGHKKLHTHNHHLSHAAAGFQTSPFTEATVLVIDAIGEFDTLTIWHAEYDRGGRAQYKKLYSKQYPNSIGLFYSAMTKHVGLHPMDEEYILMGMAAYGDPIYFSDMEDNFILDISNFEFKENFHTGVSGHEFLLNADNMDIAASAQLLLEKLLRSALDKAKELGKSNNLVYGGGVALNCLANRNIGKVFDNVWIIPNPGDAGSSLGAAALGHGGKLNWQNAFLGHNIPGNYPVNDLLDHLLKDKIVGVASGKAEFGPRALGNRSLLADPRGSDIKDRVNEIKRRQKFRPFAPVILEEYANDYFDFMPGWEHSRYMQTIAYCKYPEKFPAICHFDNTSRVQTVPDDGSGIRKLLEKWYVLTECPMLLNTSLNIRGEPMVNDRADADRFENLYKVKVCS